MCGCGRLYLNSVRSREAAHFSSHAAPPPLPEIFPTLQKRQQQGTHSTYLTSWSPSGQLLRRETNDIVTQQSCEKHYPGRPKNEDKNCFHPRGKSSTRSRQNQSDCVASSFVSLPLSLPNDQNISGRLLSCLQTFESARRWQNGRPLPSRQGGTTRKNGCVWQVQLIPFWTEHLSFERVKIDFGNAVCCLQPFYGSRANIRDICTIIPHRFSSPKKRKRHKKGQKRGNTRLLPPPETEAYSVRNQTLNHDKIGQSQKSRWTDR